MSSSTIYHIQSSAAQNNQLLSELAQVDYAPSAFQQQQIYVTSLKSQLADTVSFLQKQEWKLVDERHDYEKYKRSTVRRFAHKVVGKAGDFEAKASKEEREYFDAIQEDNKAKSQRDTLTQLISEAEAAQAQLQQASHRHSELQAQLDALYNSIFAGPTPDFPEEDAKEWPVTQAQVSYGEVQRRFDTQAQATSILQQANQALDRALRDMREALQYSSADMMGGGTWADISERNSLSKAEMSCSTVDMLVQQAQRLDPSIQPIGALDVASGHIVSDVVFDNIFSDMRMHERIEGSLAKLLQAADKLDKELKGATARRSDLEGQAKQAAQVLENARKELQVVRQQAFERVTQGQTQPNPPPYDYPSGQQQYQQYQQY